jgi:hypothetical protein
MSELVATTGSYKAAMVAVGRLKAIALAAKYDGYWTEQVDDGFHREMLELDRLAKLKITAADAKAENAA